MFRNQPHVIVVYKCEQQHLKASKFGKRHGLIIPKQVYTMYNTEIETPTKETQTLPPHNPLLNVQSWGISNEGGSGEGCLLSMCETLGSFSLHSKKKSKWNWMKTENMRHELIYCHSPTSSGDGVACPVLWPLNTTKLKLMVSTHTVPLVLSVIKHTTSKWFC